MRSIAAIDLELAAVSVEHKRIVTMLDNLRAERATAVRARDATILEAFDRGHSIAKIAATMAMKRQAVNVILWRNDRRVHKQTVPVSHLPASQQRHYAKLRRNGVSATLARQIAEEVSP